jgi:hypothetical protein
MEKIISLYMRNYNGDRLVRDEIVSGAEWVIADEGIATRKHDGTCCLMRGGRLYKRYDAKRGKTPPAAFEPAQDPDPITGHWPGWLPVSDVPEDQWHRDGLRNTVEAWGTVVDGTYELVGPRIQNNTEGFYEHRLIRHGSVVLDDSFERVPRDFAGIKGYLTTHVLEGIVWHHPDGRMVKIKRRDFGLSWPMR